VDGRIVAGASSPPMQYRAALRAALLGAVLTLSLAGCQRGDSSRDWKATPIGRDVDRICNALVQSGAAEQPAGSRQMLVAQWLGSNIESQDGRDFLAGLARHQGAAKADALEAKAKDVGLAGCPLAAQWRK
jgi:hypothetical protein